jgi:hypothetical protein
LPQKIKALEASGPQNSSCGHVVPDAQTQAIAWKMRSRFPNRHVNRDSAAAEDRH